MNNLLYIALNGYAGSGKDTVAKMIRTILDYNWNNIEEAKAYYKKIYNNPTLSATYNTTSIKKCMCIAYADQLKYICSSIFGIPVDRFYMNKSNAWINLTNKFEYTEIHPNENDIVTAEDFYMNEYSNVTDKNIWMNLREILVYIGTYVMQQNVSKSIFVNIVRNKIFEESQKNNELKYIIVTDNRFQHELDYIKENNGISIKIIRNNIKQLNNIAEHKLDDENNYDFIITNNEGYDDLFEEVWNLIHDNTIFENKTVNLLTRDNINNYIRLISEKTYVLCSPVHINRIIHDSNGNISFIDPTGGPSIIVGEKLDILSEDNIIPKKIELDQNTGKFKINII